MTSGSGSGNGSGDSPRCSISRKGKGHIPDHVCYDDTVYHEYLQQQQIYLESLNCPNPPLIIFEPNVSPNFTSQLENIHDRPPTFVPPTEGNLEKHPKSDLFVLHMKKIMKDDGSVVVVCNYCNKEFKWNKSGGYGTFQKHITNHHAAEQAKSSSQAQISKYVTPNL